MEDREREREREGDCWKMPMRRGFFHSCQGDRAALAGNYVQMCQEGVTRGTQRERESKREGRRGFGIWNC